MSLNGDGLVIDGLIFFFLFVSDQFSRIQGVADLHQLSVKLGAALQEY